MLKSVFGAALFALAACASASAGHVLDNGDVKADVVRMGASLSHLEYKGVKWNLAWPRLGTDRFLRNAAKAAESQDACDLEWRLERIAHEATRDVAAYSIVPSAFDGLRVTKTYALAKRTNELTVSYVVTNCDAVATPFAHSFVFPVRFGKGANVVTFEKDGRLVETEVRTGMAKSFECAESPGRPFAAVRGRETGRGAVLLLPRERTGGTVFWYADAGTRRFASIEYFGREEKIPPHGTLRFEIVIRFTDDVPTEIAKVSGGAHPVGEKLNQMTRYLTGGNKPALSRVSSSPVRFDEIFPFSVPAAFGDGTAVLDIGPQALDGVAVLPRMTRAKDALELDRPLGTRAARLSDGSWRLAVSLPPQPPAGERAFELALVRGAKTPAPTVVPSVATNGAASVAYREIPIERTLAEKLKRDHWMPLEQLERLADGTGLYHEPWFLPSREKIDALFLFDPRDDMLTNGKRFPLELKARTGLDVRAFLLLREVTGRAGGPNYPFSVMPTLYARRMSDWTMVRLRALKSLPRVAIVGEVDFGIVQDEVSDIFVRWREKGVAFFFVGCRNIPDRLLGTPQDAAVRELCSSVPQLNPEADFHKFLRLYADDSGRPVAAVTPFHASWSKCLSHDNPACPPDSREDIAPVYEGRDFPYFDYAYFLHAKALRLLAGVPRPATLSVKDGVPTATASVPGDYVLETELKDLARETLAKASVPVRLSAGENVLGWRAPALPGGRRVVHLRLKDGRGEVVDACAYLDDRPETYGLAVTVSRDVVAQDERVRVTAASDRDDPAANLSVWLEDTDRRVFRRTTRALTRTATLEFDLPVCPTRLYRVFAHVERDGCLQARAKAEFAVRTAPPDLKDAKGYVTIPYAGAEVCPTLAKLGFDYVISAFCTAVGTHFRQCAELGMASTPRNCAAEMSWALPYRFDNPSSPAVRSPCFSDPAFHETLRKRIGNAAEKMRYDYYNVRLHWTGDEFFLGPNVCHSEHCLKRFRAHLAEKYGSVAALNAVWGTSFASFAEATPCQLDDLPSKDRLARWLDHKMFMSALFAAEWVGRPADLLSAASPGSLCGPTGTQVPGYGYDWAQMMKYVTAIGYYDGCQRKYVHDFARLYGKDILAGQCGGGYTHAHVDFEPYNYDTMWSALLKGANLPYNYCGAAIDGDLSVTSNMLYFAASLREMKGGAAKLYLSASAEASVAVLYSQASMFAALAEGRKRDWDGAQTSWWRLLSDLKVDFDFVPYEHLAEKGVGAKYRVVVLPWSVALSKAERLALTDFAARGGRIFADVRPGARDGHGNRIADDAFAGLFDGTRGRLFGETLATYSAVSLGGEGGESAAFVSADADVAVRLRREVSEGLAACGVTAPVSVVDAAGKTYPCDAVWREDGPNGVFAMHVDTKGASNSGSGKEDTAWGRFDFAKGDAVVAHLPRKGHVYDVRAGRYIGLTDTVRTTLVPGYTRLYSVLSERPGELSVTGPSAVRRGEVVRWRLTAERTTGPQVFHVEVSGPDGFAPGRLRRNVRTETGTVEYAFEAAQNDVPGAWQVTFVHVNTGRRVERRFEMREK